MKTIKIFASLAIASMVLASCGEKLNVHNPNYFTDEEMQEYITENPGATDQILSGLTTTLYSYIGLGNAQLNGGYSNTGMYELYKMFANNIQAGDIIEGDANNQGAFSTWYQNLSSNTYWESSQVVTNYGYYIAAVLKVNPAQKALDFLTKEYIETNPSLGYARAQALTLKALAYTELMERYTDLTNPDSESDQGWPVYDTYAYNSPAEPLSVKATWDYIMDTFAEAVELFHKSSLGTEGYTFGDSNDVLLYDIDCAVAQYCRCRAAVDCKRWSVAIEAGTDLLKHYPSFIKAENYGMPASALAATNVIVNKDADDMKDIYAADYKAENNAFICKAVNPETIFGNGATNSGTQYWSVLGLNTLRCTPSSYYQMDKSLYDAMSDSDCRKACVLPEVFKDFNLFTTLKKETREWFKYDIPAYTSLKWSATQGLGQASHDITYSYANSCWYRSSAVLLMTAEAYAQSGKDSDAKALLNKLLAARTIAGKTTMTCDNTMSGKSALDMCKLQWRMEMWGEGDWAFMNRKRWGEKSYTRGSNHWSKTDVPSNGWQWEIPQTERQGNPNWNKN